MKWKDFIARRKTEIILTAIFLAIVLFILPKFLDFVEDRNGVVLPDPILKLFNPIDLTWLIFGLLYISLITGIIYLSTKPELLLTVLQSYSILILFRMIVMYVTPFNAPQDSILLDDPFVQIFGSGKILTKDLFFSGHTAIIFLFYLVADKKYLKLSFLICTILIGAVVLLQHVHYTVDVISAPFFAYASFRLIKIIRNKLPGIVK